jgi:hypothetical protein
MDFETFKRAVDSLEGYVGTIGIMGGEPTLNPYFEDMAKYLAEKKPPKHTEDMLRPQRHFMDSIHELEMEHTFAHPCLGSVRQTVDGPGLWSAIGENYKKYYETIQDTIQYQALNDHSNAMYHQPALISRKSLEISDDEWIKLRDNCWIQNLWSATITPKGAFFCEIAGALDMLFDGPGGWPIEPGWWKRTPEDFADQLHWCELCGLACETFMRNANEEVYDVSPDIYEKLKEAGSREIGTNHINVLKIENGTIAEESKAAISKRFSSGMPYTESYSARFNEDKSNLLYKTICVLYVCRNEDEIVNIIADCDKFSSVYVLADNYIQEQITKRYNGKSEITFFDSNKVTLGKVIYTILQDKDYNKYLTVIEGNVKVNNAVNHLEKLVLNPGTLLYSEYNTDSDNEYFSFKKGATTMLMNGIAHSIRETGWDWILRFDNLPQFRDVWQKKKVFEFIPETERIAPTAEIDAESRYVIYGAGSLLEAALEKMSSAGAEIVAVIDSSSDKIGKEICGYIVKSPEYLINYGKTFDKVVINSTLYYHEIKKRIVTFGIIEEDMSWV